MFRYLILVAALCAAPVHAQSVAFTFDDGPRLDATPRLSAQQRNAAMLAAHGAKPAMRSATIR